jgi:hypothetical protein
MPQISSRTRSTISGLAGQVTTASSFLTPWMKMLFLVYACFDWLFRLARPLRPRASRLSNPAHTRSRGAICSCSLPRQADRPGSDLSLRVTILQQGVAGLRKPFARAQTPSRARIGRIRLSARDSAEDLSKGWRFFATYTEV